MGRALLQRALMQTLLADCLAHGADAAYVTRISSAVKSQTSDKTATPAPNQLLIEPLSRRELEVLHLLAQGHSNQAVADELVIAISTVKKHVNNIYRTSRRSHTPTNRTFVGRHPHRTPVE